MPEWVRVLLTSTVMVAIIGVIARMLGWKFNPKQKIDVDKVKSDIRLDEAKIEDQAVARELSLSKGFQDLAVELRVELSRAQEIINKLSVEKEQISRVVKSIKYEYEKREEQQAEKIKQLEAEHQKCLETIKELEEQLANTEKVLGEERDNCKDIELRLNEITDKYNKLKEKHGIKDDQ